MTNHVTDHLLTGLISRPHRSAGRYKHCATMHTSLKLPYVFRNIISNLKIPQTANQEKVYQEEDEEEAQDNVLSVLK